ncbi:hypothetical protein SUGI_1170900 [Cryptomeria japonica]|nr:hypothetical protein SUGI_1170900 [Cryptomeria japonica]
MDRSKREEGSASYVHGGYHPVNRGDLLNEERYVVQSKLGWGGFSTVWLAWDTQLNKYVALKISKSNDSCYTKMALREIQTLKAIAQADPEDKECVVKLLDDFIHAGPHGNHVCLVLELLGDNLRTLLKHYSGKGIPLHMVKEICFHILRGLDFLHGKLSIVHTDLKPENILLPSTIDPEKDPKKLAVPLIPSSNKANDDVEEKLGLEARAVQRKTWSNKKILSGAWEENLAQKIRELSINNLPEKQSTMASLDLKCKIADLADMWSVGCIAFELATGDFLFNPQGENDQERVVNHLGLMMELLGVIPKRIDPGGKVSKDLFDKKANLKGCRNCGRTLINMLRDKFGFAKRDADYFRDFLIALLHFVPEKRPTAMQAILHPWLDGGLRLLQPSSSPPQTQQNAEVIPEDNTTV